MGITKIEWCDKSWNPITGCSPVSEGCQNCYARRMAYRLKGRYGYPKDNPFKVTFHPDRLEEPLHWKKPCRIFVCSMGDLFHEAVEDKFISALFNNMGLIKSEKHTFLILTKRPRRIRKWLKYHADVFGVKRSLDGLPYNILGENIWLGVSVEDQKTADERIPILLQIRAAKRFISVEPMLGSVNLREYIKKCQGCYHCGYQGLKHDEIDWVIIGGETGPRARPLHPDWVRSLRDQCQVAGVPFFFKGWGEWAPREIAMQIYGRDYDPENNVSMAKVGKKKAGRLLDGKLWDGIK